METMQDVMKKLPLNTGSACSPYAPGTLEQMKADTVNAAEGDLNQKDGYNCPICRNKGYIMQAVEVNGSWRVVGADCKCQKMRRTIRRLERSGLKNIIRDYTFDKFEAHEAWQKSIKDAAIAYAKSREGWFFIGGQSGCGKTHICTAICREFLLHEREVVYMLWRGDIVHIKAAVTDSEQYREAILRYKQAETLYVDDLFKTGRGQDDTGAQKPTSADINIAFEILNYRYNNKLPTIISSECTISELLKIDEAIAGRVVEHASPMVLAIRQDRNKNYRLRKAVEL